MSNSSYKRGQADAAAGTRSSRPKPDFVDEIFGYNKEKMRCNRADYDRGYAHEKNSK